MATIEAREIQAGMVFYTEDGFSLYRHTALRDARKDWSAAIFDSWIIPTVDDDGQRGEIYAGGDDLLETEDPDGEETKVEG